jgi:hypothetical protein
MRIGPLHERMFDLLQHRLNIHIRWDENETEQVVGRHRHTADALSFSQQPIAMIGIPSDIQVNAQVPRVNRVDVVHAIAIDVGVRDEIMGARPFQGIAVPQHLSLFV